MKNILALSSLIAVAAILSACQSSDPALMRAPPPPIAAKVYDTISKSVQGDKIEIDNRLDILFIIDNSDSMKSHTENLSKNIETFVNQFAKGDSIDFHIGYTLVHDRIRYTKTDVPDVCPLDTSADPVGRVNWETPGTLKQLVKGNVAQLNKEGRRYVTRKDDFRAILKANLDPSSNPAIITPYVNQPLHTVDKKDPQHRFVCNEGPENEESFTPLLGALTNPIVTEGANKGFRRPGAFFVAIIVSDAKDESINNPSNPLTPDLVYQKISEATGEARLNKRRARVFSVVISTGTKIDRTNHGEYCRPDPAFADGAAVKNKYGNWVYPWHAREVLQGENPLEILAKKTEDKGAARIDQVFSICKPDYGAALAAYGTRIQQDTLANQIIQLDQPRQIFNDKNNPKAMHVYAGTDPLTEGTEWVYNDQGEKPTIEILTSQIKWNNYSSHVITYTYTPVDVNSKDAKPL